MHRKGLEALVEAAAADGRVSAEEALAVRRAVFPDGAVCAAEAGALFDLAARVGESDPAWGAAFVEAIGDHVLGPDRFVDDMRARWLIEAAPKAGPLHAPLLVDVLRRAEAAPETLAEAARAAVLAGLGDGPIDAATLAAIRTVLFALAGDQAVHVSREEAQWLFALDAAAAGRDNDPAWGDLFVKALLNHVMGQRASALMDREAQRGRLHWLNAPVRPAPLSFLARVGEGGLETFRRRLFFDEVDAFEGHYEARLAEAANDARLDPEEAEALVAMVHVDGRTTPNEARLMEELRRHAA